MSKLKFGKVMLRRKFKENSHSIKDEAAMRVARVLLKIQNGFSSILSKLVKNISPRGLKLMLIVFCGLSGSISIYITAAALFDGKKSNLMFENIKMPLHDGGGDKAIYQVDDNSYQQIQLFEKYLDSLVQTASGQKIYDSINAQRPGLIDSIKLLKEIYQPQKK